jgi:hypothetical protein
MEWHDSVLGRDGMFGLGDLRCCTRHFCYCTMRSWRRSAVFLKRGSGIWGAFRALRLSMVMFRLLMGGGYCEWVQRYCTKVQVQYKQYQCSTEMLQFCVDHQRAFCGVAAPETSRATGAATGWWEFVTFLCDGVTVGLRSVLKGLDVGSR